jgi:hypothetical protein
LFWITCNIDWLLKSPSVHAYNACKSNIIGFFTEKENVLLIWEKQRQCPGDLWEQFPGILRRVCFLRDCPSQWAMTRTSRAETGVLLMSRAEEGARHVLSHKHQRWWTTEAGLCYNGVEVWRRDQSPGTR